MMHGRQKSDLGVVALKLANKPGRPGAESVERRPGAKGNMVRLHTPRTQGRAGVSHDSTVYGKQQGNARRSGSQRCSTTLMSIC